MRATAQPSHAPQAKAMTDRRPQAPKNTNKLINKLNKKKCAKIKISACIPCGNEYNNKCKGHYNNRSQSKEETQ